QFGPSIAYQKPLGAPSGRLAVAWHTTEYDMGRNQKVAIRGAISTDDGASWLSGEGSHPTNLVGEVYPWCEDSENGIDDWGTTRRWSAIRTTTTLSPRGGTTGRHHG